MPIKKSSAQNLCWLVISSLALLMPLGASHAALNT